MSTAAVLVDDDETLEAKEQAWLTAMTIIRSRMWPLFDDERKLGTRARLS